MKENEKKIGMGLRYARASGMGLGFFLLFWPWFNFVRWSGVGPHLLLDAELIVYLVLALLYLLPWYCFVNMRCWKYLFALLVVFSVAFVFIQVFDLMFQYMLAAGMGQKSAPAAFQSLLVFLCLLQVPVALFLRRPELLD